jgi:AraC-like DNA-binding protein
MGFPLTTVAMIDDPCGRAEAIAAETVLAQTPLVTIGRFRLDARHEQFRTFGAITSYCCVFPRRAVWIRQCGGPPFVGDPTRAVFHNPGAEYQRERIDPVGDHCEWFSVAAPVLRQIVEPWDPAAAEADGRIYRQSHAPVSASLYLRQRRIYEYVRRAERPDPLYVEEAVLHLVSDVIGAAAEVWSRRSTASGQDRRQHHAAAEAVCADLNRCFWRTESIGTIAGRVGVSVFHLCRVFRSVTGGTIHQHREQLRLRAALPAVMESDDDLLSIGLRLGFSSHSHFTAAFRRRFTITPSALRRLRRTDRSASTLTVRRHI